MGLIVPTIIHPEREDQPLPYDWFVGIDWGSQQQVYVLTATIAGWVNELWTMMEPVLPGWRTGYGRCRRDNRSG
jgi:hypothetical protein